MAKKLAFDKVLFTIVVLLMFFGLVMVFSASSAMARDGNVNRFLLKQGVSAALGLALMAWLMHVDYRKLREPRVIYTLMTVSLVLLIGVLFAPQLNATRRWFFIAGVSIQPSELAKLALIPFLAYQIERKQERVSELSFLLPAAFFTVLTAALILLEPDMGRRCFSAPRSS
jgi:cell division protein FtsW